MEELRPAPGDGGRRRESTSLRFGTVAAVLREVTRAERLTCPAFRSPPALVGVCRSIRRRRDGHATVSVALRGRPWAAVLADMVEGVVAANRLRGVAADHCRARLWAGLGDAGELGVGGVAPRAAPGSPEPGKRSNGEKAPGFAA